MHDKNRFNNGYDFTILAAINSTLKKSIYVNKYGNKTIDFSNSSTVKALNQALLKSCLLYTSPSPRDRTRSRMPSSA